MELLPSLLVMAFAAQPRDVSDFARGEASVRVLPDKPAGTPLPDSKTEQPPVIRRADIVTFALVALLVICVVAVLYAAKGFFLPIVLAFVIGTMLSQPPAFSSAIAFPRRVCGSDRDRGWSRRRVSSSPERLLVMEWSTRLPTRIAAEEKLHVFDRPLALWQH